MLLLLNYYVVFQNTHMSTKCEHDDLTIIPTALCLQSGLIFRRCFPARYNSKQLHILCICSKISGTSRKNYFYKINGDVGTAGW